MGTRSMASTSGCVSGDESSASVESAFGKRSLTVLSLLALSLLALSLASCSDDPAAPDYVGAIEGKITFAVPPDRVMMVALSASESEWGVGAGSGSHPVELGEDGSFSVSLPPGEFLLRLYVSYPDWGTFFFVGQSGPAYRIMDPEPFSVGARSQQIRVDLSLSAIRVHVQARPDQEGTELRFLRTLGSVLVPVENGVAEFYDPCALPGEYRLVVSTDNLIYYPGTQDPSLAESVDLAPGEQKETDMDLSSPARIDCRIEGGVGDKTLVVRADQGTTLGTYQLGADERTDLPLYYDGTVTFELSDETGTLDLANVPGWEEFRVTPGQATEFRLDNLDVEIETDLPSWLDQESARLQFLMDGGVTYTRELANLRSGTVGLIPDGTYRIGIEPEACRTWLTTWYPGSSMEDGIRVDVRSTGGSRRLQFDLRESSRIEGRVRYVGLEFGPPAMVEVFSSPQESPLCTASIPDGSDGAFVLSGLEAGTYFCRATALDEGAEDFGEIWYPGAPTLEGATPIRIGSEETVNIEFWIE